MNIKVIHAFPPIPVRNMDFYAYDDEIADEDGPFGYGETEDLAVADLLEQVGGRDYMAAAASRDECLRRARISVDHDRKFWAGSARHWLYLRNLRITRIAMGLQP